MARPNLPDDEKKLELLRVRVRRDERARIRRNAEALNLSLSRYVLLCCDREQAKAFFSARPVSKYSPPERRALLSLANNLNRITKRMHATGEIETSALEEILTALRSALAE